MELSQVSFAYPDGTRALEGIDLAFDPGRCYVIQGPNGCGKSTLFRILNGLSFPTEGTYRFDGIPVTERYLKDKTNAHAFHRRIGYVLQNAEIQLFTASVEDEIAFGLYQTGLPEAEVNARTEKYMALLELSSFRKRAPWALSGGEKKRCALAAVLAMEPQVLVLDEPISMLDEDGQAWISDFLASLKKPDRLLIIATHNHAFAERLGDVQIAMDKTHRARILSQCAEENNHDEG